jgi:hypothetical protein
MLRMYLSPEVRTQSQDTWFNHTCVELYLHPSRVVFLQTYPQFLHCILLFKIITMYLVRLRGQTVRTVYLPIITVYICNLAQSCSPLSSPRPCDCSTSACCRTPLPPTCSHSSPAPAHLPERSDTYTASRQPCLVLEHLHNGFTVGSLIDSWFRSFNPSAPGDDAQIDHRHTHTRTSFH